MISAKIIRGGAACCIIFSSVVFFANFAYGGGEKSGVDFQDKIIKSGVNAPRLSEVTTVNIAPYSKPLIRGTVDKGIARVKIVIDNVLKDEVEAKKGEFNYQSIWPLKLGEHFVYAVGIDVFGQETEISNIINFFITVPDNIHEPKISAITIDNNVSGADSDEAATTTHLKINPIVMATSTVMLRGLITPDLVIFMIVIGVLVSWIFAQSRQS